VVKGRQGRTGIAGLGGNHSLAPDQVEPGKWGAIK